MDDDPYYISEHRKSYDNTEEFEDIIEDNADFTIFPISITRFEMSKLNDLAKKENIKLSTSLKSQLLDADYRKMINNLYQHYLFNKFCNTKNITKNSLVTSSKLEITPFIWAALLVSSGNFFAQ